MEDQKIDRQMKQFYSLVDEKVLNLPGAGAGGGIAAGLVTFLPGNIISGIDYVLDLLSFEERAAQADLVIVGEGRLDGQSLAGKAPVGIASKVSQSTPVIAICGSIGPDCDKAVEYGINALFPIIAEPGNLGEVLQQAEINLYRTSENVAAVIKAFK